METTTLQRCCGVALGLGAVLIAGYSIAFSVVFPTERLMHDLGALVTQPAWTALGLVGLLAVVLMMIGFGGVYSRLASTSGPLGLVGLLAIELAYFLQAAKVTWELCIFPMLARSAPGLLADHAFAKDPAVAAFRAVATLCILLGVTLFSLVLFRSRAVPRSSGPLVFGGAMLYGIGPMITIVLAYVGIVVLALGCLVLARALLRPAAEAGEAPAAPDEAAS
jgi:hypothetical protein